MGLPFRVLTRVPTNGDMATRANRVLFQIQMDGGWVAAAGQDSLFSPLQSFHHHHIIASSHPHILTSSHPHIIPHVRSWFPAPTLPLPNWPDNCRDSPPPLRKVLLRATEAPNHLSTLYGLTSSTGHRDSAAQVIDFQTQYRLSVISAILESTMRHIHACDGGLP